MSNHDETSRCEKLADLLPLHAVGDTSVEEALSVEGHLERCAACRAALAQYREICSAARRELAAVPASRGDARIRRSGAAADPRRGWTGRLAAAAALLLAGVLVGRWSAEPVVVTDAGPPRISAGIREAPARFPALALPERAAGAVEARGRVRGPLLSVFSPEARRVLSQALRGGQDAGDGS